MSVWGKRSRGMLYLSCYDPCGISTVVEQVRDWAALSAFEIRPVNLFHGLSERGMRLPDSGVLDGVDVVFMHPTTAYFPANLRALCEDVREHCGARTPLLVLYKQDEHVRSHETATIIGEFGIDLVLTCVSPALRPRVYPPDRVGGARFEQVLTGFVSERLRSTAPRIDWGARSRDFLYRGSKQPPSIGRLGFEKYALASRLRAACARLGLSCDASAEWEDRILGFEWIRSLADSRATVSLESGSNCFDFDGSLEQEVARYLELHPELDAWSEGGYARLHDEVLREHEDNVQYGQIAPRHLEAAVTRTAQLMLPGAYSGLFVKDRHYLELSPDLSNLPEQWERLQDPAARENMLDCAYEEIACREELSYRALVRRVDGIIEELLQQRPQPVPQTWAGNVVIRWIDKRDRPLILLLCPHSARLDPRIDWWRCHAFPGARVEVVEAVPDVSTPGGEPGTGSVLLSARAKGVALEDLPVDVFDAAAGAPALAALCQVAQTGRILLNSGVEYSGHSQAHAFLVDHLVRNSVGLVEAASRIRGVDGIIVADLPALPAGLLLRELFDAPLLYDAQEIWPHAQGDLNASEVEWWLALERRLLPDVDVPVTVSPGIACWYQEEMGSRMDVVANMVPRGNAPEDGPRILEGPLRFVFLGSFAANRGLEQLIDAWDLDPAMATLCLQGPDGDYRKTCLRLARKTGLLGTGIQFPDAVSEEQLIATAGGYHVGIIPYVYPHPYSHCSPNKLGQYMAAGCAIVSHQLPFVESCVRAADCGVSANFRSIAAVRAMLHDVASDRERIERWRRNARQAADREFHWERQVETTAQRFMGTMKTAPRAAQAAVLDWPTAAHRRWLVAAASPEPTTFGLGYMAVADWIARHLPTEGRLFRNARRVHRALRHMVRR